ncbi:unnamed protein product [Effrenium voratum]|nr:unnamed protein product [Effrenium voratum]
MSLHRFLGTVDTGAGNGPAVYRQCLECLERIGAEEVEVQKGRIFWKSRLDIPGLQSLNCFEKVLLTTFRGVGFPEDLDWDENLRSWEGVCGSVSSFRVSCKRSGKMAETSLELERRLGSALQDRFHWALDLQNPHLEVWLYISLEESFAGLLLLRQLQRRPTYRAATGLHPNVAWAMCSAANIQVGEVVLDPMCGTGMLLTEAPVGAYVVGVDISAEMLTRAAAHLASLRRLGSLLRGDVTRLPLPSGFADVVLCDLPFGRQFGTVEGNKELYPRALRELRRVTKPSGRCVLLTSAENGALLAAAEGWPVVQQAPWNLGNKLPATVFVLGSHACDLSLFASAGRFAHARKQKNPDLDLLCQSIQGKAATAAVLVEPGYERYCYNASSSLGNVGVSAARLKQQSTAGQA